MRADLFPVPQNYAVDRWGDGYFGINSGGCAIVAPDPARKTQIDLHRLAHEVRERGLSWPVLVRFVDILHDRAARLYQNFDRVSQAMAYQGRYTAVYPIKVNQQRSVVDQLIAGGGGRVGLEAGSKTELMAVLARAPVGGVVVCNGYKDREYIRLAMIGRQLGHQLYIVIEKLSELDLVLDEAASFGGLPLLGVRVRLSSSAAGNWQNSGGPRAKFGLTARQLLVLVARLRQEGCLDRLRLLHTHVGSQIPSLQDIRHCLNETAHYYGELRRLGVDIRVVDVGGGLGVDYEGTGSQHYCSIDYSIEAYAREIVKAVKRVCDQKNLPHPDLFTESGRAMTAHHAVLIVNVIDSDPVVYSDECSTLSKPTVEAVRALDELLGQAGTASPQEIDRKARYHLKEAQELFEQGELHLGERAMAETLYASICRCLQPRLSTGQRRHDELLDDLQEQLSNRFFCNFSLFQSIPDVWAIEQIFPVMPLHRLTEAPSDSAVLHDLTCDSDGRLDRYVDQDGIRTVLPVHETKPGEPYLLGVFLVGAYQEILGDRHNLFGDTDTLNLVLDDEGGYRLTEMARGEAVEELLTHVHFKPEAMLEDYRRKLTLTGLEGAAFQAVYSELEASLRGYTYFED
ncbi:MAG: biosynthetic arginine decarboxylase [Gammaproteobacteria bacterium]|nr:biosynthetic arginine decarboxylase [Gammaproteobacteria bacterium]